MATLDPNLRDVLATVIGKENQDDGARIAAEKGARAAIEALAVHLPKPHEHIKRDAERAALRNRLRARARQLGDARETDGTHEIEHLVEQAAYEHWHRMLFARFLAECELLMHPEMKVPVTLEECAELAPSEGARDAWELAGRYASRMLPQIFRPDDPVLELRLAAEHQDELERLLASLPSALFRASDSLGWVYQFWQARKKKEVNASEVDIGADELPAVTQLFTEPYMVQFLLHNTLGAWWVSAGRGLPLQMPYLRLLENGAPAVGPFTGWPRLARELTVLDPCCGSGHFLVAAFEILVAFRMAEEKLSAREACDAVLRENLFGLEIDYRCVQIAAFALALVAWNWPGAGGYRPLAPMNVACTGLVPLSTKGEWERLAGDDARLKNSMGRMWDLFRDAALLGSLIDPTEDSDLLSTADFQVLKPALERALKAEPGAAEFDNREEQVVAYGLVEAARILADQYVLVATNPPYLLRGKQTERLKSACGDYYSIGASDLATVFLERCRRFCRPGGAHATVTPQTWLFLGTFTKLRKELLRDQVLLHATKIGSGARATASWDVLRALAIVVREQRADYIVTGLEADDPSEFGRSDHLLHGEVLSSTSAIQLGNPDARIALGELVGGPLLSTFAIAGKGSTTGDSPHYLRHFWELPSIGPHMPRWLDSPDAGRLWSGRKLVCIVPIDAPILLAERGARIHGQAVWGRHGVAVNKMGGLRPMLYSGEVFDDNVAPLCPADETLIPALLCYCESDEYATNVRKVDRALKVTSATLVKVPFDEMRWRRAAKERYPNGLPGSQSSDPTQWLSNGRPRSSESPLQVAVSRLVGYSWPDQLPDILNAHSDADGIVCIPAVRGERPAADRLAELLADEWGKDWHPQTLTDLVAAARATTLEEWLRDSFFQQHCERFEHRPFVWHVWDGHREGFSALVNYHRLDHETLKSLTWSYLGEWIRTQELETKNGRSGAGDKLAKAKTLQQRLAAILEGESPLDLFVRWKPLSKQPIGWRPDLDDGVRINIRPFMTAPDVGVRGAGVLRWKPNISWGKDRGRNSANPPWGEERENDRHTSLEEKRRAQEEET